MRQGFHEALEKLRQQVLLMGTATQSAVRHAVDSLLLQDIAKAEMVIQGDPAINQMQFAIEEECILLLARQQPVATDLRRIMAALRISIDLERIADMAVDLAKSTIRLDGKVSESFQEDLLSMIAIVDSMISLALDSYALESTEKAQLLSERDDRMDHVYRLSLEHMRTIDATAEGNAIIYAVLARCMERIGDHVTNIGENVIYMRTGDRLDLN